MFDWKLVVWYDEESGKDIVEDFSWSDNGDLIRKIWRENNFITLINEEWEKVKISLLDLNGIWDLEHDYIVEMLNFLIGESISSPEWIAKVNELAKRSYEYLQDELLYDDSELKSIWSIKFKSSLEIVKFLQSTKKAQGLKKCMLAKIARLYLDGFSLDVEEKRKKTLNVVDNKVIPNLRDLSVESSLSYDWYENVSTEFRETWKASMKWSIHVPVPWTIWNYRKIDFDISMREKTIASTISKALREKDYINQWDIMDLLWITITSKQEDKIHIMNYLSQLAFKYWEYRIKNKWGVTKEDLDSFIEGGDESEMTHGNLRFLALLEDSFKEVERRASTATWYKDVKFVPVWDKNLLSFEIMFLDYDSSTNDGLAHHKCFEFKRKIAERIRLEGYIWEKWIKKISQSLIDVVSNSRIDDLSGKKPTDLLKEMLADIIYDSEWKIIPWAFSENCKWVVEQEFSHWNKKNPSKEVILNMVKKLNKLQVEKMLAELLPKFYLSGLVSYFDSNNNRSKTRRKYTNKIGLENLSVLSEDKK